MGNFAEAVKSDKNLQKKVADAIKNVAKEHGHSIDDKAYGSNVELSAQCAGTCGTYCICTV